MHSHNGATEVATIEGYASIFNKVDLNGDEILPGAFGKKLIPLKSGHVKMLYQHMADKPIGYWTHIYEDRKGLLVSGKIILDNTHARNVWELLRGKALDGLSIGFRTIRAQKTSKGRKIAEIDLWEISIVTFPMAPSARITHVGAATKPARDNSISQRLHQAAQELSQ